MTLATAHNWLPSEVDALDPVFVDELMLSKTARADHELFSQKSKDNPDVAKRQTQRKAQLAKWRRSS